MPYIWKLIKSYEGEALEISKLERKLINMNKDQRYTPKINFSGMYECFKKLKLNNNEDFFM